MSATQNDDQAGAAVPTTDADERINLHAVLLAQEECGYTRDLVLSAYSAQKMAGRLRGINAITSVLIAGDSMDVRLGEWMRSGLVEAIHHLTQDGQRHLEDINDHAAKAEKAVTA